MKRLILASAILLNCRFIIAQETYFSVDSAEWITTHESYTCTRVIHHQWREYLDGDTLIQNVIYHRLMFQPKCVQKNAGEFCPASFEYATGGPYLIGGIREDSGKVFFFKFNVPDSLYYEYERALSNVPALTDILLYDFNWLVGDTVTLSVETGYVPRLLVVSVFFDNGLKKIGLMNLPSLHYGVGIKEGLGESRGIFGLYYSPISGDDSSLETCFYHHGLLSQSGLYCYQCYIVSTTQPEDILPIKIYPNPASDEIFIESDPSEEPFVLRIYNNIGLLVYTNTSFSGNNYVKTKSLGLNGMLHVVLTDKYGQTRIGSVIVY